MTVTPITVRPLAPDLLKAYLEFFDHRAFSDNPRWASCYCFFPHAPHETEKWSERTGSQNRQAVSQRILAGTQRGYLAYDGGEVVGWCNAGLHSTFTTLDPPTALDAGPVGAIVCFVIAPSHRRKGVASKLLAAVLEGFRSQQVRIVEAYPRAETRNDAQNHTGPLDMYLKAGFVRVDENDGTVTVRKELA